MDCRFKHSWTDATHYAIFSKTGRDTICPDIRYVRNEQFKALCQKNKNYIHIFKCVLSQWKIPQGDQKHAKLVVLFLEQCIYLVWLLVDHLPWPSLCHECRSLLPQIFALNFRNRWVNEVGIVEMVTTLVSMVDMVDVVDVVNMIDMVNKFWHFWLQRLSMTWQLH